MYYVLIGVIKDAQKVKETIEHITDYNHFVFKQQGIQVFRQATIGDGKLIAIKKPVSNPSRYAYDIIEPELTDPNQTVKPRTRIPVQVKTVGLKETLENQNEEDYEDNDSFTQAYSRGTVFHCPNEKCTCKFLRYKNYIKHIAGDFCIVRKRSSSIPSHVVRTYMGKFSSSKLEQQLSQHDRRHMRINLEELSYVPLYDEFPREDYARNCQFVISFKMGWAIPIRTIPTVYTKRQTNYAKTLFLQGQETRGKYQPEEAEQV